MSNIDIKRGRQDGRDRATDMLKRVSLDAANQYWRDHSCSDTLRAFGFWDGFLAVLCEAKNAPCRERAYRVELTEQGEQFVIPGCESDSSPTVKQKELF